MMTNNFGKGNFMQPMRRLSMHSKCLFLNFIFFLFFFLGGGGQGGGFFSFYLCSQHVPFKFPVGSH